MTIKTDHLQLNQFQRIDARELYCIRNHSSVRRFMSKPDHIPYRSHIAWVESSLLGQNNFMLLLVRPAGGKRAAGLTQLKIDSDSAEIGVIFRSPDQHQTAIAISTVLMLHLAFERLKLHSVTSHVLPSHEHAMKFNKAFGAWEEPSDQAGMLKLKLTPDVVLINEIYQRVMRRINRQGLVITAD